ncbi:MAG: [LysW]-aminoadipate/[LysW]-glutamate kinase [Candidatus Methanomethylicaceae archaeon]|nr:[LysW]-aminoadipate/[LysW]-glutamate kinase [Candidatus Verstraetearchaeota archaeon]
MNMRVVVKIGGDLLKGDAPNVPLIEDLKELVEGRGLAIVHGGGDLVTEMAKRLGKEQRFIVSPEGFKSRYTDRETAEIYAMVMAGEINTKIVGLLQSFGINAIGLSGFDGGLLRAERKERLVIVDEQGRKRAIEGGYTGKITSVNTRLLEILMGEGYTPVISPLAMGMKFEPLNVDGDRTTSAVAKAIRADAVIYLTDVEGVLLDGKIVPKISIVEVDELLKRIGAGMSTKIHAAVDAVRGGVGRAIITSGFVERPILDALEGRRGTVISL